MAAVDVASDPGEQVAGIDIDITICEFGGRVIVPAVGVQVVDDAVDGLPAPVIRKLTVVSLAAELHQVVADLAPVIAVAKSHIA